MLMITRIARKETTEMLRDGRFRWSAVLLLVLLSASLFTGWRHYAIFSALRTEAQRNQREQWLNKEVANAHVAAHAGTTIFRSYLPLFAQGKSAHTALDQSLTISSQPAAATTIISPTFWRTLIKAETLAAQIAAYATQHQTTSGREQ